MHTSATSLDLIDGIDVSSAVSRIARVGTLVRGFRFASAGIVLIAIELAIIAIVISFFIEAILLNMVGIVNSYEFWFGFLRGYHLPESMLLASAA
jgi:hypothetical protein